MMNTQDMGYQGFDGHLKTKSRNIQIQVQYNFLVLAWLS